MQQQGNPLLQTISNLLEEIIKETDQLPLTNRTKFHARIPPSISLINYIQRISKYTHCSEQCFIIGLIFLDRVQERHQDLVLNSYCIHRFVMVSIMVAIKYQDDDYYKNEYYAKVGGITLQEINDLEQDFLEMIGYELYVNEEQYNVYEIKLKEYCDM